MVRGLKYVSVGVLEESCGWVGGMCDKSYMCYGVIWAVVCVVCGVVCVIWLVLVCVICITLDHPDSMPMMALMAFLPPSLAF